MNDQAVILESVSRAYGNVRAVDNVSLTIHAGEFFTLLGSSGSGKTTTLRLIGGFETPDAGRVLIGGVDVTRLPAYKRNVHTVFQDYALFPHLNVFDNVAFALSLKNLSRDELRRQVGAALELVQLAGYEDRKPGQLSGGQQQRVALARAIVDHPAVLLLDEPLSALDAKIRGEVREEIKRLQRETRITFVYVTHDQEEALTMSDRLAVMRGGRVLQLGTPLDVYERPADLFVAEFVGKANFLDGQLPSQAGTRATIRIADQTVDATLAFPIATGAAVRVMIRPENLRLQPPGQPGFTGVVTQSQYLGHATQYLVQSGALTLRVLELRRRGTVPHAEGAAVVVNWNWEEALVYPQTKAE